MSRWKSEQPNAVVGTIIWKSDRSESGRPLGVVGTPSQMEVDAVVGTIHLEVGSSRVGTFICRDVVLGGSRVVPSRDAHLSERRSRWKSGQPNAVVGTIHCSFESDRPESGHPQLSGRRPRWKSEQPESGRLRVTGTSSQVEVGTT